MAAFCWKLSSYKKLEPKLIISDYCLLSIAVACVTARLSTCWLSDRRYRPRYESRPGREIRSSEFRRVCYRINILSSQLSPSSINLVPAQAGKVTVGLASHWPCVTDNSGIGTHGLAALGREMSTHAVPLWGMTLFTFTLLIAHGHAQRGHNWKLKVNRCRQQVRRCFVSQRIINTWNKLPASVVEASPRADLGEAKGAMAPQDAKHCATRH